MSATIVHFAVTVRVDLDEADTVDLGLADRFLEADPDPWRSRLLQYRLYILVGTLVTRVH